MFLMSAAKNAGKRFLMARVAASQGLKTKFFDDWQSELDEALQCLPETDIFPHELFRTLMKMSEPNKRKIILVTERGCPVAVAGLRNRWGYWEPVTQWIVPGVLFPVRDGYLARVLPALGLEMHIAWWRWQEPPPQIKCLRNAISEPTFGISLTEDFEQYWRKTSHLRNVRTYRNRCKDFELKVNSPGGVEWTIRNWEMKWRSQGIAEKPDLAERLLVADYLQKKRFYYSLVLFDRDEPIAGGTLISHRNQVVAQCSYSNPKYDWHGVMTRHIDLTFVWAKDMGFDRIDLGGSHDYKQKWAPQNGEKWKFDICPENILLQKQISALVSRTNNIVNRSYRKTVLHKQSHHD